MGSGGAFVVPLFVASAVCVVSGLLAIGHARLRELESLGSVTRGGHAWPLISFGIVAAVVVAIPVALFVGTSTQDALASGAGSVGAAIRALLAAVGNFLGFLESGIAGLLSGLPSGASGPSPSPMPSSTAAPSPSPLPLPGKSISLPGLPALDWLARAGLVVGAVVLAIRLARLIASRQISLPASATPEERSRGPKVVRFGLHAPRPAFRSPFVRRRHPTSAVGAYVALLDELAGKGELARGSSETPRSHAGRAAGVGLPALPLGLLAADYELEVYGRTAISKSETARALRRWERLRKAAQRLPKAKR
jgi:hypothetical protein